MQINPVNVSCWVWIMTDGRWTHFLKYRTDKQKERENHTRGQKDIEYEQGGSTRLHPRQLILETPRVPNCIQQNVRSGGGQINCGAAKKYQNSNKRYFMLGEVLTWLHAKNWPKKAFSATRIR